MEKKSNVKACGILKLSFNVNKEAISKYDDLITRVKQEKEDTFGLSEMGKDIHERSLSAIIHQLDHNKKSYQISNEMIVKIMKYKGCEE